MPVRQQPWADTSRHSQIDVPPRVRGVVIRGKGNDRVFRHPDGRTTVASGQVEGDESGLSAYVPELPTILVTRKSVEELTSRASEAIQLWWETSQLPSSPTAFPTEIQVESPA
jgi:predicted RNase H-like HicB family nuclease